jgi:hypothetical protein
MSAKHLVRCDNCSAKIREKDRRMGFERGDRDQPSYEFSGCVLCVGDPERDEAARDAYYDAEFERQRTADMEAR